MKLVDQMATVRPTIKEVTTEVEVHPEYVLSTAREEDIEDISSCMVDQFIEKIARCGRTRGGGIRSYVTALKSQPWAWKQYGIVRERDSNKIVGAVMVKLPFQEGDPNFSSWARYCCGSGEAHIEIIFVSDNCRGKGIGTSLMTWANQLARVNHCNRITLEVVRGNRAINLYERQGYKIIKSPDCIDSVITWILIGRFGAFLMEKQIV